MADLNKINTRIQLKYDSYANWKNNNPELLAGEIAIAKLVDDVTITTNENTGAPVLFKVGPGKFNDLPWASALAADVYAWGKAENVELINEKLCFTIQNKNGEKEIVKEVDLSIFATDAEIGDLSKLSTTNKTDLVTAINEVRQAVEVGGTGSVVTVRKDGDNTYHIQQGGTDVEVPIELGDGELTLNSGDGLSATEVKFGANDSEGKTFTIAHAIPTGASAGDHKSEEPRTYVTNVKTDNFGHIIGVDLANEVDQDLSNYKTKQTAITAANNDGTKTVKISQNENGEISVEQVNIAFPTKVAGAETADKVANKLTIGSKEFDGSAAVEIKAADLGLESAMHFIGALSEAPADAKAGDVYLNTATKKEYVYDTTNGWVELGDEGSYALRTVTITGADGLTGGGDLTTKRTIGIADGGVTTVKIADGNVTYDKLDAALKAKVDKDDNTITTVGEGTTNGTVSVKVGDADAADVKVHGLGSAAYTNSDAYATAAQGALADSSIQQIIGEPDTVALNPGTVFFTASASDNVEKQIVMSVSGWDDKANVKDLHEIATTGSIYDIAEGANTTVTGNKEYLVFYCGTATDLID